MPAPWWKLGRGDRSPPARVAATASGAWARRGRSKLAGCQVGLGDVALRTPSLSPAASGKSHTAGRWDLHKGEGGTAPAQRTVIGQKGPSVTHNRASRTCDAFCNGAGGPAEGTLLSSQTTMQLSPQAEPVGAAHTTCQLSREAAKLHLVLIAWHKNNEQRCWWSSNRASSSCACFCLAFVPIKGRLWACKGHGIASVCLSCHFCIRQAYF